MKRIAILAAILCLVLASVAAALFTIYYGTAMRRDNTPFTAGYNVALVGWGSYCQTSASGGFLYTGSSSPPAGYYYVKVWNPDDGEGVSENSYYFDGTNPANKNLGTVKMATWKYYQ